MDAFETLIAMLVRADGYWTAAGFKVDLSPSEKEEIGLSSCPRWELDIVAYKAATNEALVIECKSFLDSKGVRMSDGKLMREATYKLFNDERIRRVVLGALSRQLEASGLCQPSPRIRLVLAAGKVAPHSRREVEALFKRQNWELRDEEWICERLMKCAEAGYENDVACLVAKLLARHPRRDRFVSDGSDVEIISG